MTTATQPRNRHQPGVLATLIGGVLLLGATLNGQEVNVQVDVQVDLGAATHVVVPQRRAWSVRHHSPQDQNTVAIESIAAHVHILEHAATTTLDIAVRNHGSSLAEAVVLLPVPDDAAVSGFAFEGSSSEPTAQVLPRDDARRIYDEIVRQVRDPALLEFAGYNLIRSSVFPVQAGGTQHVRLTYENVLQSDGARIDYLLPRSESLLAHVPWQISVEIESKSPISMIYSPSHNIIKDLREPRHIKLHVDPASASAPGAFRLSHLLERSGVSASMFAYPDPKVGGGYFLLMAGLPARIDEAQTRLKREVTLVLDRSGSMAGGKLDQVRAAAMQIIEGLDDGEMFNIIDYSHAIASFAEHPVQRNDKSVSEARVYLRSVRPNGGTNIHDALVEALRQDPTQGMLPLVLFLTDGLPTVGNTSERAIRQLVEKHNTHERRVFTFGVGADVNVPLLERLAEASRAMPTFVLPDEDVELKVAQTFRRLYGPVLSDVNLVTHRADGQTSTRLVRELMPSIIPDVFEGDQIILLGQYTSHEPVTFELSGNYLGTQRTFTFAFDFDKATTRNAFVPRLWASRRVAYLVDQIRQAGADSSGIPGVSEQLLNDPRTRELVDEIVRLSTEFGVLSEYTAFLAREGTNLNDWDALVLGCSGLIDTRAVQTRAGVAALNQGVNIVEGKKLGRVKYDSGYWNAQMQYVQINNVQQINDKCFFNRGNDWIDASTITKNQNEHKVDNQIKADRVVEFGSVEHLKIVYELAAQHRQGSMSMPGDIYMEYNGETILIKNSNTSVGQSSD